jgi:glycosyltransferase involved in cell wall biosynthesis
MISILIPIYNGIEFINESVESVLNQTYDKWELIIGINGHPADSDTYKLAKEYEHKSNKIRVLDLYDIKGKSNALNYMLQYCKYDWVALLDVDDIWHPFKLEIQTRFLPHYDVIGSRCVYFGDIQGVIPSIPIGNFTLFDFTKSNPIINSSALISKNLCFWYELDGIEDYDLWLRLRKSKKKFYNCPDILVKHRIHKQSAFNSKGHVYKVGALLKHYGNK